jgi:uncharacterized protein (DUF433 family)
MTTEETIMNPISEHVLRLPEQLREEAAHLAAQQGISLGEFVVWAVAEKVGSLRQPLDDPRFPGITYRRGASGRLWPVLRGHALRVQTLAAAAHQWKMTTAEIAQNWDLSEAQVTEALGYYEAHRSEIDAALEDEVRMEEEHVKAQAAPG